MSQSTNNNLNELEPSLAPAQVLLMLLAVAGGTLAAALFLPLWLPGLTKSLLGAEPKAFWYLSRASGFVAYLVLWLSVAFGLIVSNRMARLWNGGPALVDLHQFTTWLAVGLTMFHALILLGDRYIQSTVPQVVVPFAYANYKPDWVGLGQLAFYLVIVIAASFYVRKQIGYRAWRLLHYTSFVVYLLITVHGIFSGTDTRDIIWVYVGSGAAIYFLTSYRVLQSVKSRPATPGPRAPRQTKPSATQPTAE